MIPLNICCQFILNHVELLAIEDLLGVLQFK
jgi:hypothetical protein